MQSFPYLLVCQHYFHRIKYISRHTLMMSRQLNMTRYILSFNKKFTRSRQLDFKQNALMLINKISNNTISTFSHFGMEIPLRFHRISNKKGV